MANMIDQVLNILSNHTRSTLKDGREFVLRPKDMEIESLEHLSDTPHRQRGIMRTGSLDDFVNYCTERTSGTTKVAVFVNDRPPLATAVLGLGTHTETSWEDDTAVFTPEPGNLYRALLKLASNQQSPVSQDDIVAFLEDWGNDIVCQRGETLIPPAAAVGLFKDVTIESLRKQRSNMSGAFEREHSTAEKVSMGQALPDTFVLRGCEVIKGVASFDLTVRVSIFEGASVPTFALRLLYAGRIADSAAVMLREQLEDKLAGASVYSGNYTGP